MANHHIIQKQVLEVEMENPADAFQFRTRLGEVFHELILPRLTVLFDELGTDTKTYRIETLTIDAGSIAKQNWEELLTEKIISEARQAIQLRDPIWVKQVAKPGKNIQPAFKSLTHEADHVKTNYFKIDDYASSDEVRLKGEFFDVFLGYLKTGNLSWHVQDKPNLQHGFELFILPDIGLISRLEDFIKTATEKELLRLVFILPFNLLNKLIEVLHVAAPSQSFKEFLRFVSIVEKVLVEPSLKQICLNKALYLPLFTWMGHGQNTQFQSFIASACFTYFKYNQPFLMPEILKLTHTYNNTFLDLLNENFTAATFGKEAERVLVAEKIGLELDESYIMNAGLVMLHPFLPQLFKEINLTVDKAFINEQSCMKAILLTHFMATGVAEAEEYELAIEKLLCGLHPAEPVLCNIELLDSDKQEVRDLLAQVIQLWKQNGVQVNGTIEGLQQSFLQRQGKLTSKNTDWRLQVQQLPYDMVLSSLPWSISMIKTPWMKGVLWTEWA